jgi:hypothetical protein
MEMPKEIKFTEHYWRLLLNDIGVCDSTLGMIRNVSKQCIGQWRERYKINKSDAKRIWHKVV